jgi:hypothetical protein
VRKSIASKSGEPVSAWGSAVEKAEVIRMCRERKSWTAGCARGDAPFGTDVRQAGRRIATSASGRMREGRTTRDISPSRTKAIIRRQQEASDFVACGGLRLTAVHADRIVGAIPSAICR